MGRENQHMQNTQSNMKANKLASIRTNKQATIDKHASNTQQQDQSRHKELIGENGACMYVTNKLVVMLQTINSNRTKEFDKHV